MLVQGKDKACSFRLIYGDRSVDELGAILMSASAMNQGQDNPDARLYWMKRWPVIRAKAAEYLKDKSAAAIILTWPKNNGYSAYSTLYVISKFCVDNRVNAYPILGISHLSAQNAGSHLDDCIGLDYEAIDRIKPYSLICNPNAKVSIGAHRTSAVTRQAAPPSLWNMRSHA